MHHGTKGMKWGVRRMLQKMGKRYDSDVRWHASTGDKKYDKAMSKSIAKDKAQLMGMTNKYEIKAKRSFDSSKYDRLRYGWDNNKVNAKRASKISDKMNKAFEENKGTLTKLAANKSRAYSVAGKTFLAGAGAIGAAMAISKFGNSKNQKLMTVGRNLAIGGLITAAGSGYAALAGMHYGDKQFETEGNIYARVKKSTRV
uniref:Uncharacterized protein n=1 Tax=Siphoviridae sp. ctWuM9 TaxID=2826364 RepID=A0A8S5MF06_9CAUD|nr:MAG TPA: hypothetical protein [Siphoviridae sp. ctWuM9]